MIDPNSTALLSAGIFPAPTSGNRFNGPSTTPTNLKEEVVRIDHNFTSKFSVFGHFIAEQVSQGYSISQWSGANIPTVGDTFGNPSYSAVVHATYSINPNLLNETAFNYNGNRINIIPFAGAGLSSLAVPTGFTSNRLFTGPNNLDRIPNIDLKGTTGTQFEISSWPWVNKADDYQIRDDISWTHGAHQFKFGGSWALYKKVQDLFGQTQGGFSFDGSFTGSDFADYLLGTAKSYQELAVQDKGLWNNVSWAAYVQDNWRVNRKLTLNLGLRWDGVPHTYEANNRMGNFYPSLYDPAKAAVLNPDGTVAPVQNVHLASPEESIVSFYGGPPFRGRKECKSPRRIPAVRERARCVLRHLRRAQHRIVECHRHTRRGGFCGAFDFAGTLDTSLNQVADRKAYIRLERVDAVGMQTIAHGGDVRRYVNSNQ